jgi:hypothetical protein
MNETPECCYIGERTGLPCGNAGVWRICWPPYSPDDYTESCTRHVGEMLTDAPEHRVLPLDDAVVGRPPRKAEERRG